MLNRLGSRRYIHNITPFKVNYGPGGRSSNSGIAASIFGAYGFLGRYFANELGSCGSRVYIPFRGCELEVRHFKPMFDLGQLGLIPFSPRDDSSITASLQHSDVVVNMIGKHYETKHLVPTRRANGQLSRVNYSFEDVHVTVPRRIAKLAREAGVKTFIHVSALAADVNSKSTWRQTKALGELAVREEFPDAIIVRPSTLFGPEDRFLNMIAEVTERLPFTPLVYGGSTLVQPVAAVDVGKALMEIVREHKRFAGCTFNLAGPAEYSYKEVVEFVSDVTTVKKPLIDIPLFAADLAGRIVEQTISPMWTRDMLVQLSEDVILGPAPADGKTFLLTDVVSEMTSMDKASFDYLHRFRPGGHFTTVKGYH